MTTSKGSDKASSTANPTSTGSDLEAKGLKDTAATVADEASRTLETTAARGMTQVGNVLHQVAGAVRQSGETLQTEQPQVSRFISTAADKLDEAATFVSDREPTMLMADAQQVARRQPALVIGGGLVAGLLIGRALKSAGGQTNLDPMGGQDWYSAGYPSTRGEWNRDRYGASSGYGTGYGASYDQTRNTGSGRGDGSGHLVGVMSNNSDPTEG